MKKRKVVGIVILIIFIVVGIFFTIFLKKFSREEGRQVEKMYTQWKENYIENVTTDSSRVINPEEDNITVSEGIGYGMLFSVEMNDQETFDSLWEYEKKYENSNGLMNWKIDSSGTVLGVGSATDAEEDMAFALIRANEIWKEQVYLEEAKRKINAIKQYEISEKMEVLPGDSWGDTHPFNPSYVAPYYYEKFQEITKDSDWEKIKEVNVEKLMSSFDEDTGFMPDWVYDEEDDSQKSQKQIFGYESVRVPIRMLQYCFEGKEGEIRERVTNLLKIEGDFVLNIGLENLKSEYSLDGLSSENYINSVFLSSYYCMIYENANSTIREQWKEALYNRSLESYYGDSLRLWSLIITRDK